MEITGPVWFLGVDAAVEAAFFLIALLVTITAIRAYRLLHDARYKTLSWGFGMLSASYLVLAIANAIVAAKLRVGITAHFLEERLEAILSIGIILHCALFLMGLLALLILYYDVRDMWLRATLVALVLCNLVLAGYHTTAFYVLTVILLASIVLRLWLQGAYRKRWMVQTGFSLIFTGEIFLGILFLTPLLYVAAHVTALAGFSLILASNLRALRR